MLKPPTTIESNHIHRGRVIDVSSERLRYANGREHEIDFVRHPAARLPWSRWTPRAAFCLKVRQYRHGILDFMWEIPAGKLDAGEAPEVCALRELREETGVTARHWTSARPVHPGARDLQRGDSHALTSPASSRGGHSRARRR